MATVAQAFDELRGALGAVDGVRGYLLGEKTVDPPATVLVPPRLEWLARGGEPTEAVFGVPLIVPADDRAASRLITLLPRVIAAIEGLDDAVVRNADAGTFLDLPAYLIQVEYAL